MERGCFVLYRKRSFGGKQIQAKTGPDDEDYFRFIFIGSLVHSHQRKIGDPNIARVEWIDIKRVIDNQEKVRSPEIIRELSDYVNGKMFSLDAISMYVW